VISITDGQIFLENALFNAGVKPAVNAGISVSRVGGSAQIPGMKKIAGGMRLNLAQYRELAAFAQFGSDLDKATQQVLRRGERLTELLKQPQYQPMAVEDQIMVIYAGTSGGLDDLEAKKVLEFEKVFLAYMRDNHPEIAQAVVKDKGVSDASKLVLDEAIKTAKAQLGPSDAALAADKKARESKAAAAAPKAAPAKTDKPKHG